MIKIYTLGVYGLSEAQFFDKIQKNNINLFIDIRIRRGMRGSKHSFVNSSYLQEKLKMMGIKYIHYKELAPTQEMRDIQQAEDKKNNVKKSSRKKLSEAYIKLYNEQVLDKLDFEHLIKNINNADNVVLFCVEQEPYACHRSLIADYLSEKLSLEVEHL